MRKTIIFFITLAILACMVQPAFALQPIFETLSEERIALLNRTGQWDEMIAVVDENTDKFQHVIYYVKSTGASSGIRYRTKFITFSVGEYGPAIFGANEFRSQVPGPGETIYDKIILDRDFFRALLGSTFPNGPALVAEALDTETYLNVGAVIEIYNANTGQVLATINSPEECQSKAGAIGFGAGDIADMKTRWQKVFLREAPAADIIATEPHESKDAWTSASHFNPGKTLSQRYNNGDTVDLKFIFHNEAKDIAFGDTNYIITHWGAGTQGAFENQTMPAVKKGAATEELSYAYTIDLDKVPDSAKVDGCIRLVIIGDPDKKVANSDSKKNYMSVNIPINGIDIMVLTNDNHTIRIKQGETATLNLSVTATYKYFEGMSRDPITVDVNIKSPTGTITERITIVPFTENRCKDYELPFTTGTAGVYVVEASVYPVGVWDIDLSNNTDRCEATVIVGPADEPYKGNTDKETRVNLVG